MRLAGILAVLASGVASAQPAPVAPAAPAAAPGPELSLEDAIHLALTRNERTEVADLNIVVADAGVMKARVAFLPVVNLTANDTVRPFDSGTRNSAQAQLTVTQPIIAPSAFPLYEQAKEALAAELAQAHDDKRRLAFDAAKAYFQVQQADSVVQAAQHKLDTAQNDLKTTDAQFKAQLVSSNDVTRSQVVLAGAQRDLAGSQSQLDAAWFALEFICNETIPRKLADATALVALAQQPVGDVAALITTGRTNRPDLIAHVHSARAAHEFAKEPRYRFFPTLSVSGTGIATTQAGNSGHDLDMSLAANVQWQIWDGGSRDADARSRDAQAAIADLTTTTLIRQIDSDIRTAAAQVSGAQAQLVAANASADASRQSATETAILYHQGLAKAIELLDANDERFEAEVAAASAVASLANAYLALRLALGEDPLPQSTSGGKP